MSREIIAERTGGKDFLPTVYILKEAGQFVRGKVTNVHKTQKGNPAVDLELIDTNGAITKSVSKGVFAEVDVNVGDQVTLIATVYDLRDKLPKLAVGDVVTITFTGTQKVRKGIQKLIKVLVD